ncbi:MAG: class I SAM-dependent methyltransferase [Chloroflexi bacterium]|nr:class I SAM-dependent methyltransferase [Chloroflexota bacterium]
MSNTEQYATTNNLNVRMALHQRFSTNPQGWAPWLWEQIDLQAGQRVLEVGCGTGSLWVARAAPLPGGIAIVLSDTSEGMLRAARATLGAHPALTIMAADAQCLSFDDASFDVVIANHMLYHVTDQSRTLSEIARVLKPSGVLYASTAGRSNLSELGTLLRAFDARIDYDATGVTGVFNLENGAEQLRKHFGRVALRRYPDSLHISEAQPLADYVLSLRGTGSGVDLLAPERAAALRAFLSEIIDRQGAITLRKDTGLFIAADPRG